MKYTEEYKKQLEAILKIRYTGTGGIYMITCTATGHRYIGSTNNFRRRFTIHLLALSNKCHVNHKLQTDYDKFGADTFKFSKVKNMGKGPNRDKLYDAEQYAIDTLNPEYNIQRIVERVKYRQGKKGKIIKVRPAKEQLPVASKGVRRLKEGVKGGDLKPKEVKSFKVKKDRQPKQKQKGSNSMVKHLLKKYNKKPSNKQAFLKDMNKTNDLVNARRREVAIERAKREQSDLL